MMVFFIISRLLLLTLLLRGTEGNEEEDDSERFGEFCLRIPDDSRWTTPKPDPQPTRKSAQTNQPTKQTSRKPLKPNKETTLPPDPDTQDYPEVVTSDNGGIPIMPLNIVPRHGFSGCRCTTENMKQPSETSKVIRKTTWFPTESCNSAEDIETLADGREVCVRPFSLLTYVKDLLSHSYWSKPQADLPVETQKDKTTQSTQQWNGPGPEPPPPESSFQLGSDVLRSDDHLVHIDYTLCTLCMPLLTISDQRTVQSLDVEMQPFPCLVHIEVNMKDGAVICLDLNNFEQELQYWKISLPLEDDADSTPKNVAGCRCQEEAKKPLNETSPIASASIWPPTEECSSTEFIETLKDGAKVCVAASNISAYLKTLPEKRLVGAKDPVQVDTSKHVPELSDRAYVEPELIPPGPPGWIPNVPELSDRRGSHAPPVLIPNVPELSDRRGAHGEVGKPCTICGFSIEGIVIGPKDVQSLEMLEPSPGCAAIIQIRLTDGMEFCATLSEPWFRDLMEKLDI
ncbi:uncharacterized protein LOC110964700 [Acanthochromis polyacanthus]|uniref:uncharacterized protein LOC110964700 n=1 Tax=Acanthochromis polyacanthus TaxID=80966 RepID=UPI002234B7E4|nr:uncharacterized protein LOC110964700 [Acanthochromis polyacanthus]